MRLKSEGGSKKREAGIKNVVRNEKLEAGMESFVFLPAPCFTFASCFLLSWSYILTAITNHYRLGARTMENTNSFDWLLVIKDIAWFAPLVCTYASVHCAIAYAKCSPRHFSSLATFAMAWAVLLPYYGHLPGVSQNELLSHFQGLLLVIAGGPLRRQADILRTKDEYMEIRRFDRWALIFLLLLIVPHFIELPNHPHLIIDHLPVIDQWIGAVLLLLGYWSIADGVKSITRDNKWIWLAFVLALYAELEIMYSISFSMGFIAGSDSLSMPYQFLLAFAAVKLVTTALFLWLVVRTIPRPKNRCAE